MTGIKVIDLIAPFMRGGKIGTFGGAGTGKTVIIQELINNIAKTAMRAGDGATALMASPAVSRSSLAWVSAPARATTSTTR